jgi:hypothetical protein
MTRFDLRVPVWTWSERTPAPARRRPGSVSTLHHAAHRSTPHPFTLERWGRVRTRVSS